MAGLALSELTKSYEGMKVLDNISLEVKDREFCILLGPSGCGKSTILRLIAGLEAQESGSIWIGGQEVSYRSPKQRDIAMVFQSYALYPHMNVFDNMAFALKMKNMSKDAIKQKVLDVARLLHIPDLLTRKPRELSGGQRQRVAIGRAIVRDPALFLFDEPLSNLDAKLRSAMRLEIAGMHKKLNKTIVYVTHDQIEAMTLGEKIVLIDQGRIQQIGTPSDVYDHPANIFVATFIGSPQINLVSGTIKQTERGLRFSSEMFCFDMKTDKKLVPYADKPLVLGLRPESLAVGPGPIRGTVAFVEHPGAEKIVYVNVGDRKMTARAAADRPFNVGQDISLFFQEADIHLFHQEERIGP